MRYFKFFTACAVALSGCVMPSAVRVEPLGPKQFMITCVDSASFCAKQAVESCPGTFDVISNTVNEADYGRMTMIIRCD